MRDNKKPSNRRIGLNLRKVSHVAIGEVEVVLGWYWTVLFSEGVGCLAELGRWRDVANGTTCEFIIHTHRRESNSQKWGVVGRKPQFISASLSDGIVLPRHLFTIRYQSRYKRLIMFKYTCFVIIIKYS